MDIYVQHTLVIEHMEKFEMVIIEETENILVGLGKAMECQKSRLEQCQRYTRDDCHTVIVELFKPDVEERNGWLCPPKNGVAIDRFVQMAKGYCNVVGTPWRHLKVPAVGAKCKCGWRCVGNRLVELPL